MDYNDTLSLRNICEQFQFNRSNYEKNPSQNNEDVSNMFKDEEILRKNKKKKEDKRRIHLRSSRGHDDDIVGVMTLYHDRG